MSTRYHTIALLLLSLAACRGERPPTPAPLAPKAPSVTPVTIDSPDVGGPDSNTARWGNPPRGLAKRRVKKGTLRRDGDIVVFSVNDGSFSLPAALDFGDCVDSASPLGPAPSLQDASVDETAAWLRFQGESEGVLLRLSPYSAVLLTDDDCLREADITSVLLGTPPDDSDAVFAIGSIIPDDAAELGAASAEFTSPTAPSKSLTGPFLGDARSASLTLGPSSGALSVAGAPVLTAEYDLGQFTTTQGSFAAYAKAPTRWYSLSVSGERSLGKRVSGREEALTWESTNGSPRLVARATTVFAATEPEREDEALVVERHVATSRGGVSVIATRTTLSDAQMVGAGRCPEMEGVLEYRFRDEKVVWKAWTANERLVVLGEAVRKSTEASGCLDEATREIARARRKDSPRTPQPSVRWAGHAVSDSAPGHSPTISGR